MAEKKTKKPEPMSSDEAWVRQMAGIALGTSMEAVPAKLVKIWLQSIETVRRKASESIGDIQVVPEYQNKRNAEGEMETIWFQCPSIKDQTMPHYRAESQTTAILLALGEKHLGYGYGRDFAKYGGRMLGIDDGWTQAPPKK